MCVNFYEILADVGINNQVLVKAKEFKALGGPLTEPLTCGNESMIETFYSAKMLNET